MVLSNAYITDADLNKTGKLLWETIGFTPKGDVCAYNKGDLSFLNELKRHNVVTGWHLEGRFLKTYCHFLITLYMMSGLHTK